MYRSDIIDEIGDVAYCFAHERGAVPVTGIRTGVERYVVLVAVVVT